MFIGNEGSVSVGVCVVAFGVSAVSLVLGLMVGVMVGMLLAMSRSASAML